MFLLRNVLVPFLYLITWSNLSLRILDIIKLWYWDESRSNVFWTNFFNLNSISAHNHNKVSLLTSYILVHNFDIICLSETDDRNLEVTGCYLLRAENPSNNKRGGACIFCRTTVSLRLLNISYLSECIIVKIGIGNKVCRFINLYR